jgi:hypothetical protein
MGSRESAARVAFVGHVWQHSSQRRR